jgi:hypothetical protein
VDTSIAVLGNGVWGKKLNALFQSWGFKVSQYGARSFLELNFERQQKILDNDVVWIASTPDLQLRIISDVSRYQKKSILILEKPFFRDLNEQIKFVEIMNNSDLYLRSSSPWVYSDIWSKSKKKLLELLNPLEIIISRSGPSNNKSIRPYMDWLSHDVQLMADLFSSETKVIHVNRSTDKSQSDSCKIHIRLNDGSNLDLSGGLSVSKISYWKVQDKRGHFIEIDFNSKLLQCFGSNQVLIESYKSPPDDNPLLNMVLNYTNQSNDKKVESFFRWQEVLI